MIVTEADEKFTRDRITPISGDKKPIEADAYYSIREVTDRRSPFYLCSPSTIFKALRDETLKASYINRKVLIRGSAIHAWLNGDREDKQ